MMNNFINENIVLLVMIVISLIFIYIILNQRKTLKSKNLLLLEHEEKITYLRKIHAEYEYKQTQKEHANEKKTLELNHTIESLEEKINDGTKNQVVAKIEAFKNKRDQQIKRVNLG